MDQAPARIGAGFAEQPFDGAGAEPGFDLGHLPVLFGRMDMDRAAGIRIGQRFHLLRIGGPQRVRCDADGAVGGQMAQTGPRSGMQRLKALVVAAEPKLTAGERLFPGAAKSVEDRKVGEADPGLGNGGKDPLRGFSDVVVGPAARTVVDVVELGDRGVAGLQHLDIDQRGDRLDLLGREHVEKAVHQFPPAPEIVVGSGAVLRHSGHGALEGVAVEIGRRRKQYPVDEIVVPRIAHRILEDIFNAAIRGDGDADIACPAFRKQSALGKKRGHGRSIFVDIILL